MISYLIMVYWFNTVEQLLTLLSLLPLGHLGGKRSYDLHEDATMTVAESYQKGVDPEASWTKKGHNLYYSYKHHILLKSQKRLILAVSTTKASIHDSAHLHVLLDKVELKAGSRLYADKGYSASRNETLLKHKVLKSAIQKNSY